jgi:hypothetical protein
MFHMTNDSHLFHTREDLEAQGFLLEGNRFVYDDEIYLPLYEGRMIHHFDHRAVSVGITDETQFRSGVSIDTTLEQHTDLDFTAKPRYWVEEQKTREQLPGYEYEWFYGFKDVTSPTNERTFIGTLIPFAAVGNKVPLLLTDQGILKVAAFTGSLSTFVFDYTTRQKIGGVSLNFYIVEQLPVLPPDRYTPDLLRFIVPRVLELTYTAWDLRPFADDVWAEALGDRALARALLEQWEANRQVTQAYPREAPLVEPGWPRPPFTWHVERRSQLRAELDALYAHLYGLSREELAYILETFPIVKRKDEAKYGEYRTKRLVLEAYEGSLKH